MRSRHAIQADLAEAQQRLLALQVELEDVREAERASICALFDAGLSPRQIARDLKLSKGSVDGIIYRAGRSLGGRTAIRHQIREAVSAGMAS